MSLDLAIVEKLKAALPGLLILTPDSPGYEKSLVRFTRNGEKRAGMVVYPTSAKEVATIVLFSQEYSLDLAVCGGGHSPNASSTEGGICLDLSKMRAVSVDQSTNYVTVQGGARWSEVYAAAGNYGLALVGGVCGDVGVGGLGTVGGYGWLTGAHGLSIDNLVQAEVVLSDGSIVTASRKENPDLYWAMRGAGPCFGVATSIVFQGHPIGQIWYGDLVFPPSAIPEIVDFVNHILKTSKGESSTLFVFAHAEKPVVSVSVFYNGSENEAKKVFAPLLSLNPIMITTKVTTFAQTTMSFPPSLAVMSGGSIMAPMDVKFLESLFEDYAAFVQKIPDGRGTSIFFETHPTYGTLLHSQTETAFPNRGNFSNVLIATAYKNEESGPACKEWTRYMNDKVRNELERRKVVDDVDETTRTGVGEYINYDGLGESPERLYGVNYDRLVSLKKKYDPNNVLNKFVDLLKES